MQCTAITLKTRQAGHAMLASVSVFLLVCAVNMVAFAQAEKKIAKKDVPASIIAAFAQAYPKAIVKTYIKEQKDGKTVYELESKDGSLSRDVIYAADGTVLEVEEAMDVKALPEAVAKAVLAQYPKAALKTAEKITKGAIIEYEVGFKSGKSTMEMVLDANGTVVKPAKK